VLGGTSSINGMLYVRGHPRDFDLWRQQGCEGWGYADVLPYFKRAEGSWRGESAIHGGSGPLGVSKNNVKNLGYQIVQDTVKAAGLPMTDDFAAEPEGFGIVDITVKNGRRTSASQVYLRPALSRPNLTVVTNALTHRVRVERGRAVGIDYERGGALMSVNAAREVIVSGGSYNSPQILLLSGIGPADELATRGIAAVHDLPGVGRNLSEHVSLPLHFAMKDENTFLNRLRFDKVALSALQWAFFGTGDLAQQALTGMAFLRTRPEAERPEVQLFFDPIRMDAEIWFPVIKPVQAHMLEGYVELLHPESRGRVTLRSTDPADKPRILLNLLDAPEDRATLRRGIRLLRQIYATPPLGDTIDRETFPGTEVSSDEALDVYLRENAEIGHHPVGTCAMGTTANSVVDPQLCVHGLEGLRVVDASIMPAVPGGNTNAPTIMIAEKAADMIRGRQPLLP
jgi:choline dehydrogenase